MPSARVQLLPAASSQFLPGPSFSAVGDVEYSLLTRACNPFSSCDGVIKSTPWWGNRSIARDRLDKRGQHKPTSSPCPCVHPRTRGERAAPLCASWLGSHRRQICRSLGTRMSGVVWRRAVAAGAAGAQRATPRAQPAQQTLHACSRPLVCLQQDVCRVGDTTRNKTRGRAAGDGERMQHLYPWGPKTALAILRGGRCGRAGAASRAPPACAQKSKYSCCLPHWGARERRAAGRSAAGGVVGCVRGVDWGGTGEGA